jgi:subtilisin family serine protease
MQAFAQESSDIVAVEPESYAHALHAAAGQTWSDTLNNTWGLNATRAARSSSLGDGIRVAVLDSGLEFGRRPFPATLVSENFVVPNTPALDDYGHGTHVAGTICGPRIRQQEEIGYGVAPNCLLLVGKILDASGECGEGQMLEAIRWALRQKADIISLSVGSTAFADSRYSAIFEQVAQVALGQNSLIIAAAGTSRIGTPLPVFSPANCPSIMAVGAIDHRSQSPNHSS